MTREQLEHLIRAAGGILQCDEVIVIGSQAILAARADAPAELCASIEADLYPAVGPERADIVDGAIGELSLFHETYGYYAHGVGPETAVLPARWRERALVIDSQRTRGVRGICPCPADLAVSKLIAGRDKDLTFVRAMLAHGMVSSREILALLAEVAGEAAVQVRTRLAGMTS